MLSWILEFTGLSQAKLIIITVLVVVFFGMAGTVKVLWAQNGQLQADKATVESNLEIKTAELATINLDKELVDRLNAELMRKVNVIRANLTASKVQFRKLEADYEDVRDWSNGVIPARLLTPNPDSDRKADAT